MNFYKLINGRNFVGVVSQREFRKYQHKHKIILDCDVDAAQYVQLGDEYYRDTWMLPTTTDDVTYRLVQIIPIDEEEYNTLYEAVESGENVELPEEIEIEPEEPIVNPIDEATVEYVKTMKLKELSSICNQIITAGFDIELSDGKTYHFSLTTQDQLNLTTLSALVSNGETAIPYHADGEPCKFYSANDIMTIISTATAFKTYQVTYHNALKLYVESLSSMDEIKVITYGVEIPVEYQSDVLKALIANQV